MTRLVLIFFFACAIIGSLADPKCGENEYLENCPVDSSVDYCPKSEEEALQGLPPTPNPCPKPACKCRFNYRYASRKNKTCIPTRECPPFKCKGINEEFNSCPPLCPNGSCSQATPDGTCPKQFGRIGIVLRCQPKCRCIKNYWKQDGVCIPYAQCPQNRAPVAEGTNNTETPKTPSSDPQPAIQADPNNTPQGDTIYTEYTPPRTVESATASAESTEEPESSYKQSEEPECGENEYLDNCPVDSSGDYCPKSEKEALQGSPPTPNPCPKPACKCRFNYRYASRKNKTCIPTRECPPFKCKGINEEFNPCPPLCPDGSCSQATPDGTCPKQFGRIGIVLECQLNCRCIKNYWKQDGVCIPYAQCPQNRAPVAEDTNDTETPKTQSSDPQLAIQADPDNTPQEDNTYTKYTPPRTDEFATASAESSEECDSSSEETESSSEETEDKRCSGQHEEYVLKKQTCPPEFCYAITARIDCTNEPPRQPGCACKPGYYRLNETSPCMHMCECPQMANSLDCA